MLRDHPHDLDTSLLSVRAFSAQGKIEQALEHLVHIKSLGLSTSELIAEIQSQLNHAAIAYGHCFSSGEFDRALKICDLLVELCPTVLLFQKARLGIRGVLERQHSQRYFSGLAEMADACKDAGDFEAELEYRLEIFRHPLDTAQHSARRLQNIFTALSRILRIDLDVVDAERLGLARQLLTAIPRIPATPLAAAGFYGDIEARYDRFYRCLSGTIDLDVVFGPAIGPQPFLPIDFVSSAGVAIDISAIARRSRELGAKVVFFTSASAEYFGRYAQIYVSSILSACDCSCMVFVCVCAPHRQLVEIVSPLCIDDPRLVFCADGFDPRAREFQIFSAIHGDPSSIPGAYYATAALLRVDCMLEHLGLPVFVTGIDTVLQSGVADLVDRFADADLVLNKMGPQALLGSQLINNLVLTYPTANGLLFTRFLKQYLGAHLAETAQPAFLDQLDLHMAKHHVLANGVSPKVGYFGEFDINNLMFTRTGYRQYLDQMRSYRFLNMFVGGGTDDPLTAEDVAAE